LFSEYTKCIVYNCLLNKKIDPVLDNRNLNFFNNINKSINLFIIVFLEYPESIMFFLVFRLLINTKVRIDNKTNNIPSLNKSFY
jgi:hypothetical protein